MLEHLVYLPLQYWLWEAFKNLGPEGKLYSNKSIYNSARKIWGKMGKLPCEHFEEEICSLLQAYSWDDLQRRPGNGRMFLHGTRGYWGYKTEELPGL